MAAAGVSERISAFFADYPSRTYGAGEVLIMADAPAALPVYYLESGMVGQYDVTDSGNRMMCNIFKPGTFFPMSNAFSGQPSPYFFEAMAQSVVRVAPPEAVVAWLHAQPAVVVDLLARVYRGTDGLIGRMMRLMSGTAAHRIAFELAIMAERFGEPATGGGVYIRMTETQLASQTGLARETISRELAALKRAGVVRLQRGGLTVHPERLDFN